MEGIHHSDYGRFSDALDTDRNFVAWQQLVEVPAESPRLSGANIDRCTWANTVDANEFVNLSAPTIEGTRRLPDLRHIFLQFHRP